MKNKNGFTLIELLAVIVILAIIALVAVPIVLNMINSARKKSAESSAYGFIDAIEYNNGFAQTEQPGYTEINGTNLDATTIDVKMKGKKPSSGTVTIENGKVTNANLCVEGYTVVYNGREVTSTTKGCSTSSSNEPATPTYTAYSIGQSINYNPATNQPCDTPTSTTGTKTGCMKWYVIKASGTSDSTVDVILDHNTTATVAYETSGTYKEYAQASIKSTVDTDTTGWTSGLNPRLITADEVAHITGADTAKSWTSASSTSWFCLDTNEPDEDNYCAKPQGTSSYKWLFDYTNGCTSYGCDTADSNTYGYWTSSAFDGYIGSAWGVIRYGGLNYDDVSNASGIGVRPVITISKSDVQ
jgi:type IV pilus assembly protein PilA